MCKAGVCKSYHWAIARRHCSERTAICRGPTSSDVAAFDGRTGMRRCRLGPLASPRTGGISVATIGAVAKTPHCRLSPNSVAGQQTHSVAVVAAVARTRRHRALPRGHGHHGLRQGGSSHGDTRRRVAGCCHGATGPKAPRDEGVHHTATPVPTSQGVAIGPWARRALTEGETKQRHPSQRRRASPWSHGPQGPTGRDGTRW